MEEVKEETVVEIKEVEAKDLTEEEKKAKDLAEKLKDGWVKIADYEKTHDRTPWNIDRTVARQLASDYAVHNHFEYESLKINREDETVSFFLYTHKDDKDGNPETSEKKVTFKEIANFMCDWDDMHLNEKGDYFMAVSKFKLATREPEQKTFIDKNWESGKMWFGTSRANS